MKKSVLLFAAAALLTAMLCGCGKKKAETGFTVPQRIKEAIKAIPEDALIGIGAAKAESDGEAILKAEDEARAEISRQMNTMIQDITKDYDDGTQKELSIYRVVSRIVGSRVVSREKDKKGNWWCVVQLSKDQKIHEPETGIFDILSSNAVELSYSDMASKKQEVERGGETIKVFYEETASIPDWVLNPGKYQPEDVAYGLGSAKLDNDEDSIKLAKERARRSLARSLDAEVTEDIYEYTTDDKEPFQEEYTSVTSVYDHTAFPAQLGKYTKTKDGTWWVLLKLQMSRN